MSLRCLFGRHAWVTEPLYYGWQKDRCTRCLAVEKYPVAVSSPPPKRS